MHRATKRWATVTNRRLLLLSPWPALAERAILLSLEFRLKLVPLLNKLIWEGRYPTFDAIQTPSKSGDLTQLRQLAEPAAFLGEPGNIAAMSFKERNLINFLLGVSIDIDHQLSFLARYCRLKL